MFKYLWRLFFGKTEIKFIKYAQVRSSGYYGGTQFFHTGINYRVYHRPIEKQVFTSTGNVHFL
jgi:hypothetical protein